MELAEVPCVGNADQQTAHTERNNVARSPRIKSAHPGYEQIRNDRIEEPPHDVDQ
jgi:hypothetical protein